MRRSFSTASRIENQVKKTSRKISPTIGTLSGLVDDQPEVRIEGAEDEEHAEHAEHAVADRVRGDLLALPHHHHQRSTTPG